METSICVHIRCRQIARETFLWRGGIKATPSRRVGGGQRVIVIHVLGSVFFFRNKFHAQYVHLDTGRREKGT